MIMVSVIVPVYNVEKYLAKCLDSLVNQTLQKIEIIVVNDGSTDDSQTIIDEYVQKFPDKIKSLIKANGGLSDARNYGLPYAVGEYIGFVDSDDYIDKYMYERMYQSAKEHNSDIVTCDYYKVYGEHKELVKSRDFLNQRDMLIGSLAAAWNKIYKRELITKSGVVFPKGLVYEDTAFFAKLIPYCKRTSYVNEPFVYYIQRQGSIANSQGEKTAQIFDIFDSIISFYKENGFYTYYKSELEYYCIRIAFGSNLERISRINDFKQRRKLAINTYEQVRRRFSRFKSNKYLSSIKSKRHIFIKMLTVWNMNFVSCILYLVYKKKDKELLKW